MCEEIKSQVKELCEENGITLNVPKWNDDELAQVILITPKGKIFKFIKDHVYFSRFGTHHDTTEDKAWGSAKWVIEQGMIDCPNTEGINNDKPCSVCAEYEIFLKVMTMD
jgi:hypothetical protein